MKKCLKTTIIYLLITITTSTSNGDGANLCPASVCQCFRTRDTFIANCTSRGLDDVPANLPKETRVLLLNSNAIVSITNHSFSEYTSLTTLDLSHNNISRIEGNAFEGLHALKYLYFENCFVSYKEDFFTHLLFRPLTKVKHLFMKGRRGKHLSHDKYPVNALQSLVSLESLSIDGLFNSSFDKRFLELNLLHSLSLSGDKASCFIEYLHAETFSSLPHLETLNLSSCNLKKINPKTFRPLHNLKILDLSQNPCLGLVGIENATSGLRNFKYLNALYLNSVVDGHATCVNVKGFIFENLHNTSIKKLHLDDNRIETFTSTALQKFPPTLQMLSLKGNRFTSGIYLTQLQYLTGLKELHVSGKTITTINFTLSNTNRCQKNMNSDENIFNKELSYHPIYDMESNNRVSTETNAITFPPNLTKLVLSYQHVSFIIADISLPRNVLKHIDLSRNLVAHWIGPVSGLGGLTHLDLSYNMALYVSQYFFRSFHSLVSLDISHNHLKFSLENDRDGEIFKGLSNLIELDVSENLLQKTPPKLFQYLTSLQTLNLSHNDLMEFNISVYHMKKLHTVDCSHNNIRWIWEKFRIQLDQLAEDHNVTLNMANNTLDCTCQNIFFLRWLHASKVKNGDLRDYRCMYNSGEVISLTDLHHVIEQLQQDCCNHLGVYIGVTSAFMLFLGMVFSSICYRFRWRIRFWYYTAKVTYSKLQSDDFGFEFDCFVSYAEEDREFVVSELKEKLENEAGLRLNIHQRDFTAGRPIASNIIEAVKNSKKTLVIFSEHFIQSYWCNYELQMANMESVTTGRDVVLVLRLGHVPTKDIPAEIIYHFQTDSYIEYPQNEDKRFFWRTLASSLKA